MRVDPPTLSVCIVTFNSADTIVACLESVVRQRGVAIETIVIDNASTDDSAARAERVLSCRVIRNSHNVFFTAANNQAWQASRGEFVLALNPDAELEADTAATMVEALRAHPDVGAAICTVVGDAADSAPEVPHWWRRRTVWDLLGALQPSLWWRERRGAVTSISDTTPTVRDVDVISNACLFARRAALAGIGGYDERYRLYFVEDDLCHRLRVAGWRVCYFPVAQVRHHGATSVRKVPRLRLRWFTIRDSLTYARQYLGLGAWGVVALASALDLTLVAAARSVKWLVARRLRVGRRIPNAAA